MQDAYVPAAPDQAACPACGHTVTVLAVPSATVLRAYWDLRCPACRQEWTEVRARDGTTRHW